MSIATEISRLQTAKANIKSAIEDKGVVVPASATLDTYDEYISGITTGGGSSANEIGLIQRTLTSYDIPSGATIIGDSAFNSFDSLRNITIPDSVTCIGLSSFNGSGLTGVTIPSSVTEISNNAFYNCYMMQEMTFQGTTPPTIGGNALGQTSFTFPIYVPDASVSAYKTAYTSYADRIYPISEKLPSGYTRLPYIANTSSTNYGGTVEIISPVFDDSMAFEYKFELTEAAGTPEKHICSGNKYRLAQIDNAGNWKVYRGGGYAQITSTPFSLNTPLVVELFKENDEIKVNGSVITTLADGGQTDSVQSRFFSVAGSSDYTSYGAKGKLYYLKVGIAGMWGTYEGYLVPAQRNSDGKVGMYDLVSNVFGPLV